MKILFTFAGGFGHFTPLIPIARAAVTRGDDVLFGCQPAMLRPVGSSGFVAVDSGGATVLDPAERGPLVPVDRRHEEQVIRDFFAGRTARERAHRLMTIATEWGPDVIVRDEVDFGAAVVAERLGIQHVAVIVLAAGGLIRRDIVSQPLNQLRVDYGLPSDPTMAMLQPHFTIAPFPATFRHPDHPLPASTQHIQPAVLARAAANVLLDPATTRTLTWLAQQPRQPTVYFTLGTVFPQVSGDLFLRVMTGLSNLEANIVITVGGDINPTELGTTPSNVHIERFVPQQALLPYCNAVLSHAGSGSVMGSLAFGLPLVLLPMGADQPWNADRCEELGVARVLDPLVLTGTQVRAAVTSVLGTASYQQNAERIRYEIELLPGVDEVLEMITS